MSSASAIKDSIGSSDLELGDEPRALKALGSSSQQAELIRKNVVNCIYEGLCAIAKRSSIGHVRLCGGVLSGKPGSVLLSDIQSLIAETKELKGFEVAAVACDPMFAAAYGAAHYANARYQTFTQGMLLLIRHS